LRRFRQGNSQNAAFEIGFDFLRIDAAGNLQRAAEGTEAALGDVAAQMR
jgi:hypothetical protein